MSLPIYHTHTHTLRDSDLYTPFCTYTHTRLHTLPLLTSSQLMSYICFWLFFLFESLYPHCSLPLLQHFTIFLSLPLSFFTSLSLLIPQLFLSLPVPCPLSPCLSLSVPLFSLWFLWKCLFCFVFLVFSHILLEITFTYSILHHHICSICDHHLLIHSYHIKDTIAYNKSGQPQILRIMFGLINH